MDRADLTRLASPPCQACGSPVSRVEFSWVFHEDDWRIGQCATVCTHGHRIPLQPFDNPTHSPACYYTPDGWVCQPGCKIDPRER